MTTAQPGLNWGDNEKAYAEGSLGRQDGVRFEPQPEGGMRVAFSSDLSYPGGVKVYASGSVTLSAEQWRTVAAAKTEQAPSFECKTGFHKIPPCPDCVKAGYCIGGKLREERFKKSATAAGAGSAQLSCQHCGRSPGERRDECEDCPDPTSAADLQVLARCALEGIRQDIENFLRTGDRSRLELALAQIKAE